MPSEIIYLLLGGALVAVGCFLFFKLYPSRANESGTGASISEPATAEEVDVDDPGAFPHPLEQVTVTTDENEQPVAVRYGEDFKNPLFEVELYEKKAGGSGEPIKNLNAFSFLGPVLQRLPDFMRLGAEVTGKVYRVKFPPEVTKGLLNGSLKLMSGTKAMAVSATGGQVKAIADIVSTAGNPVTLGLIGWQIAAVVTAQHFLAEIDNRLARIEQGLSGIRYLMLDEMKNTLSANIVQLRDLSSRLQKGKVSEAELTAVYSFLIKVEGDCLRIIGVAKDTVVRIQNEVLTLSGGSQGKRKEIIMEKFEDLDDLFRLYAHASYAQVLNCYVRSFIPCDLDSIFHCLDENEKRFRAFDKEFSGFRREMRHAKLNKKNRKGLHDRTKEKGQELKELMQKINPLREEVRKAIEQRLLYAEKPLELAIEIDPNGEIKRAEHLSA